MSSNPLELTHSSTAKYDGRPGNSGRHTSAARLRRKVTRENVEAAQKRIPQLIESTDERIALETCKWILEQAIGRAPLRVDGRGQSKPTVDNRLQIAIQSLILPKLEPAPSAPGGQAKLESSSTQETNVTLDVTSDPSGREGPPGQ